MPTLNPGRVNVVTTPWSNNWLTHINDAAALTDLGFSAFTQTLPAAVNATALGVLQKWPVKHTSDYASLNAMITALGAGPYIVHVDGAIACAANTTCGSGIQFVFEPGAIITVNNGVTLTLNSPDHLHADPRQHLFTLVGTGVVAFSNRGRCWGNWWGADPAGVADSTAAIAAALVAAGAYGECRLAAGTYLFSQLTLDNPITFGGLGTIRSRWNSYGADVTLLSSGASDPAILIGGSASSVVVEGGGEIAERVFLEHVLVRPNAGAGRGILIDGSTTLRGSRSCARDIGFVDVHLAGYTDHNMELLGNVFDVRFHGGSSRACATTAIIGTTANKYGGGTGTPSQIHFYDFYAYGNAVGPQYALDGQFTTHGGGIAYGSGFRMGNGAGLYGTHIEGGATAGSVGLLIAGRLVHIVTNQVRNYETGIKIGENANSVDGYVIQCFVQDATTGVQIVTGGSRLGAGCLSFINCTTDIVDDRAGGSSVKDSLLWLDKPASADPPSTGNHVIGQFVWKHDPAAGMPVGWRCRTTGAPGTWVDIGTLPGAIGKAADYPVVAADIGKRFCNAGAGGVITFTLPVSAVGMRLHFTRVNSGQACRIDPNGAEFIRPNGSGKYISLDTNGASISLECIVAGEWVVTAQSGTISVEP